MTPTAILTREQVSELRANSPDNWMLREARDLCDSHEALRADFGAMAEDRQYWKKRAIALEAERDALREELAAYKRSFGPLVVGARVICPGCDGLTRERDQALARVRDADQQVATARMLVEKSLERENEARARARELEAALEHNGAELVATDKRLSRAESALRIVRDSLGDPMGRGCMCGDKANDAARTYFANPAGDEK